MKRIVVSVIVLALTVSLLCACGQSSQGIGETGISADEFDSLYLGMEKDKVNETIGGTGELISESKDEDDDYIIHKHLYRYEGEIGGYAELEFTQKVSKDIYQHLSPYDDSLSVRLSSKTKYDLK